MLVLFCIKSEISSEEYRRNDEIDRRSYDNATSIHQKMHASWFLIVIKEALLNMFDSIKVCSEA